jgi:hypothetical protein
VKERDEAIFDALGDVIEGETIRRTFVKIAVRVHEIKGAIKLAFPAAYPHQAMLATITGAITASGP